MWTEFECLCVSVLQCVVFEWQQVGGGGGACTISEMKSERYVCGWTVCSSK